MSIFWFQWLSNLLAGILLGGVLFTSFLTAPIVFIVLDQATATRFTRKLWPRYFLTCATLGLLLTAVVYVLFGGGLLLLLTGCFGVLMAVNYFVAKRIRTTRGDAIDEEMEGTVEVLHRLSVWINYLCLVLIAVAHYLLVAGT